MKLPFRSLLSLAVAVAATCAPLALRAQSSTPVYVVKPVADFTVPVGTTSGKVNLKKTFGLTGITGDVVRFTTSLGNVDVQLLAADAPATVANFLSYVSAGAYGNTFFSRSVPGFVVQGGGYFVTDGSVHAVTAQNPVVNEYKISNTRGTIAMAKLPGDPNSATDEWFFNLADNASNLDNQNGGFTVFGSVLGDGMNVVDAIAALTVVDASGGDPNSPFTALPVLSTYQAGASVSVNDLAYTPITVVPLLPKVTGDPALLKVKVKSNSNPGLVTPTIQGTKLFLTYASGVTGSATITLVAKTAVKHDKVNTSFTVTVQ